MEHRILLYSDAWCKDAMEHLNSMLQPCLQGGDECKIFHASIVEKPSATFTTAKDINIQYMYNLDVLAEYEYAMLDKEDFGIFNGLYGYFEYREMDDKERLTQYINYMYDKFITACNTYRPTTIVIPSPITAMRKVIRYHANATSNVTVLGMDFSPFEGFYSFDPYGGSLQTGCLTKQDVWKRAREYVSVDPTNAKFQNYLAWHKQYTTEQTTRGCISQPEEVVATVELPPNFIFLVGQSGNDANQIIHLRNIAYDPVLIAEFVVSSLQAMGDERPVVFKKHPEDISDSCEQLEKLGIIVIQDNVNIHTLLEACDAVVTWNSNVGIEALLYYKPVVVLGDCFYRNKGFTCDIDTLSVPTLITGLATKPDKILVDTFLAFLTQYYLIDGSNASKIYKRITKDYGCFWE